MKFHARWIRTRVVLMLANWVARRAENLSCCASVSFKAFFECFLLCSVHQGKVVAKTSKIFFVQKLFKKHPLRRFFRKKDKKTSLGYCWISFFLSLSFFLSFHVLFLFLSFFFFSLSLLSRFLSLLLSRSFTSVHPSFLSFSLHRFLFVGLSLLLISEKFPMLR